MRAGILILVVALSLGGIVNAAINDNLVAYYPLEDGSGLVAADRAGTNDGILAGQFNGTNGWTTGKIDGGLEFTRSARDNPYPDTTNIGWIEADGLLDGIGESGVLNDTDSYTFSAWAKWAPQQGGDSGWGYAIWGANTVASANGNVMRIGANKTADGVFTRTDHAFGAGTVDWTDQEWHLFTITFGPDGNADWYIDGSLVVSKADDPSLDREKLWSTGGLFQFGMEMEGNQATDGWSGKLDELAIWNRELTAQEISDLYNNGDGVSLLLADPELPGDANGSGYVDDLDLAILLGNWEQDPSIISTWGHGNFTEGSLGDTDVDDADLAVLLGNWTGPPPPGGAAVPEPATLALLSLGGLSVLRRRRS